MSKVPNETVQESAIGIAAALEQVYNDPTASNIIEGADVPIISEVAGKLTAYGETTEFKPEDEPAGPGHDQFGDHNTFNCTSMAMTLGEEELTQFVLPLPHKREWLDHLPGCQRCICYIASLMFSEPSEETLEHAMATKDELGKLGVSATGKDEGAGFEDAFTVPGEPLDFPLLDQLQQFRERCRQEPAMMAQSDTWNLEAFNEALERVGFKDAFDLIHGSPKIADVRQRRALHKFGLEMIDQFNKGSEHNSLVALLSAMMVWQELDPRFQGF